MTRYRHCVVCSEQFEVTPHRGKALTCGAECSKERRRQTKKAWRPTYVERWNEIKDPDHIREYHRDWKRDHRAQHPGKEAEYARARAQVKREHINALRRARHARVKAEREQCRAAS